jgi:hypothetical protein
MNKQLERIGITLLLIAIGAPLARAQFEHPDLKSGKMVVHKTLILPPQARVIKSGMKGGDSLIEESRMVETALPAIVTKALQDKGCTVLENAFAPAALEKDQDLKYAVADIQGRFDELRKHMDQKPKDVRKGRYTLGDEVSKFNPGAAADALVFVRAEGVLNTGGKKAFATVFGGLSGAMATRNTIIVNIAVVDAQSGAVLYYGRAIATGNFVSEPEHMSEPIVKSFKEFGPAPVSKKS